jgi:beta-1,4-mannosyltransferase
MNHKIKVLFAPKWDEANPYQRLLKRSLEDGGCDVALDNYPTGLLPLFRLSLKHRGLDVLHMHWISPYVMWLTWSKNPLVFSLKYLSLLLDCFLLRLTRVKLVWTIHNKFAHENNDKTREVKIRRLLAKWANKLIFHSKEAMLEVEKLYECELAHKSEIIFHGNYDNCYPGAISDKKSLKDKYGINDKNKVVLFFGSIKKYKGVETLLEVASKLDNKNITFLVAGEPIPSDYSNKIRSLAKTSNIKLELTFLDDQSLINLISLSDVVILPFSDTLTSGSVILAMTCGKGLILPDSAKVFGCVPSGGVRYFSDSESLQQIIINLTTNEMHSMGVVNIKKAKSMTWDRVGYLTANLYESV